MNTICERFKHIVAAYPSQTAVIDEKRKLSYEELDKLSDAVAAKLPHGAKRIGIAMEHGVAMVAAILAVLKKGCAYIPVEPDFPSERIRFMMKDSAVDCIVTQNKFAAKLDGFGLVLVENDIQVERGVKPVQCNATVDDLAYVLYTSGTTGKPKGVAVTVGNVCHYVDAFVNEFHPGANDVMLQYSVCSFDIFVEELFTTLLSGAMLAIPSNATKRDIKNLMAFVDKHGVTEISGFPYLLAEMNELDYIPSSLRLLISGGDVLRASYTDNLIDKVDVYNTYGPSETTVCATYFRCNGTKPLDDGTYPIGKSVRGSAVTVLGDDLAPVKDGEIGEICITGGGVSRGYIGDRAKENAAFVTLPNGERLYRSGDLGYTLPDGNIAFCRRKDFQIMIYGKRVEPEEVENVLCNCPEIKHGVVKTYSDENSLSYMVAYFVPKSDVTLSAIKRRMSSYLPPYMIPEFFVKMNKLPVTPNGKVDTRALPVVMKAGNV